MVIYTKQSSLCLLGSGSLDQRPALLLEQHDVESVKVRCLPLGLVCLPLLSPCALGPLLCDVGLVEELLDNRCASSSWEVGDNEGCEGGVAVANYLAGNTG